MMEFSPSNAYVEDWRIKSRAQGTLLSLELIEEKNLTTETCRHRGGAPGPVPHGVPPAGAQGAGRLAF